MSKEKQKKTRPSGHGLGRGLGALIGTSRMEYNLGQENVRKDEEPLKINVKDIIPNPYQPRKVFDKELLQDLANSIKEHGIIQPLIVRQAGKHYELVAGERRWRAASMNRLKEVPVLIRKYTDEQMMEIALVENIQRHNLNPLEEAIGIKKLMAACKLTQEAAAEKVGRSRVAVANILRLLNLPKEIQNDVSRETLTMGQVKPLLALDNEKYQLEIAKLAAKNDWSARLVEKIVKYLKDNPKFQVSPEKLEALAVELETGKVSGKYQVVIKKSKHKKEIPLDAQYKFFEDNLVTYLGTKVKVIPRNAQQGKIEIVYNSVDDLSRIYELLQKTETQEKTSGILHKTKFTV
jgi:ParB family chromosome partitioning protein